jgi:hypothetical protein
MFNRQPIHHLSDIFHIKVEKQKDRRPRKSRFYMTTNQWLKSENKEQRIAGRDKK